MYKCAGLGWLKRHLPWNLKWDGFILVVICIQAWVDYNHLHGGIFDDGGSNED